MNNRRILEPYIVAIILFMVGMLCSFVLAVVAEAQVVNQPRYAITDPPEDWLSVSSDTFPCELIEPAYSIVWNNPAYEDNDNNYDIEVIDWEDRVVWKIHTHAPRDFALVWSSFEFGTDGNPHPDGAWMVDCERD